MNKLKEKGKLLRKKTKESNNKWIIIALNNNKAE